MATLDQLSDEQRAIIELVLQRQKSYEDLADLLGMTHARVQELARAALVILSPVSAKSVDDEWRGQLADYVLGQQSGPESTATRGHLRRSEQARTWTRSLLDSLDRLYKSDLPTIPDGERGGRERLRRPERVEDAKARPERRPSEPLSPEAEEAVRQRRIYGGIAAAVVLLLIVLVWPIGLLTGDDDKGSSGSSGNTQSAAQQTTVIGQVELKPVGGAKGQGVAVVATQNGKLQMVVQARLTPTQAKQAYEVWLYNSQGDAKSLGAQVTDQQGNLQGAAPLPANYKNYKFIDVSLESTSDNNAKHSATSVLRAPVSGLRKPPENSGGAQGGATGAAPQQQVPQQQAPQQQAPQGQSTTP